MTDIKTMKIGNKNYAQVSDRLKAIHEKEKNFSINTECIWVGEKGIGMQFKTTITIKNEEGEKSYTGHSFGIYKGGQKEFEKLESISVGRALAFAGYLADGEIASYEEMEDFTTNPTK